MKRHTHGGAAYALSTFFAGTGVVLALVVAAITLRALIAPNTQTWTVWTTTALALLGALAIVLWVMGTVLAARVHRARRDRVRTFLTREERDRVLKAVATFEAATSGEIRVHLAEHSHGDPIRAAARAFERLGMMKTAARNGVLLFVSVRDRQVAVIGDQGIHLRVAETFWAEVVLAVEAGFAEGRFADGLVNGIAMAGAQLAEHYPHSAGDKNELPDTISE